MFLIMVMSPMIPKMILIIQTTFLLRSKLEPKSFLLIVASESEVSDEVGKQRRSPWKKRKKPIMIKRTCPAISLAIQVFAQTIP